MTAEWISRFGPMATVVLLVAMLVIAFSVMRAVRRRQSRRGSFELDLSIDISALRCKGPGDGVHLEFYGTPVRIAVLVLAPVGRSRELPTKERLPELIENLVPGLLQVLTQDEPIFRKWPVQLSTHGFMHSFFNNLSLPGTRGKGTPWCAVAGKFSSSNQQFLAGLVCSDTSSNGLGTVEVQHDGQWADVLRVRKETP